MIAVSKNSKGFSLVEVLLAIIAVTGVLTAGFYVYNQIKDESNAASSQNNNATKNDKAAGSSDSNLADADLYKSVITFNDKNTLTQTQKDEIRTRLAEPLSFYHFNNLDIPLKEISIEKKVTPEFPNNHTVSYVYAEDPETNKFGFIFNPNDVRYWQPELCDPGGCNPYPESLKAAYPANFAIYESCLAAEGDKERVSALGCNYVN